MQYVNEENTTVINLFGYEFVFTGDSAYWAMAVFDASMYILYGIGILLVYLFWKWIDRQWEKYWKRKDENNNTD